MGVRQRVRSWHWGKVALCWVVTLLVSYVVVIILHIIEGSSPDTDEVVLLWILIAGVLSLFGPAPLTWMWLSGREESNGDL